MTVPIDGASVVERSPSVHVVELEGEAVLLDQDSDRLHLLNATATLVWKGLDGASDLEALGHDLARTFEAEAEQVCAQVVAVARRLVADGIARVVT